jgi:hypothetical protein
MIRSPHRALERLDTSVVTVPHAVRSLTLPNPQQYSTDTRLRPRYLEINLPRVGRVPAPLEPVQPRTRVVAHVPILKAPRRFPVGSLDLSRKDVALPYGLGRYATAATVKAIAGGGRFDRLMRKTGDNSWEFVDGGTRIDLTDGTQEFRLGRLAIFS